MPINWSDPEVKDRLLASIIASFDQSINCREVARIYGGEMTYNAIENFLRKPKKKAAELKTEAKDRDGPAASQPRPRKAASGSGSVPATPTKKTPVKDGVKSGRVTKTPSKGKKGVSVQGTPTKVKEEIFFDEKSLPDVKDLFDEEIQFGKQDESVTSAASDEI